jgi:predicted translin family RNA/ssDNA-binding protein
VSSGDELACPACGKVHPNAKLITLPDGTSVGSYSQAYRAYTEAKWVFEVLPVTVNKRRKKTPQISRREYILGVQDRRGQAAADELANNVTKLWKASK